MFSNDDHYPLVELTVKKWNIKKTWPFFRSEEPGGRRGIKTHM